MRKIWDIRKVGKNETDQRKKGKKERGVIIEKHCAASALDDKQEQIKKEA